MSTHDRQPESHKHTPHTWQQWEQHITQQQPRHNQHQQTIVTHQTVTTNNSHGNDLLIPVPANTIRILLKNPNGIVKAHDRQHLHEWKELGDSALTSGHTILGLPETNYAFTTNRKHNLLHQIKRQHKQAYISTSRCIEMTPTEYQPGGTLTMVLGPLASRVQDKGQDKAQMGRWSYVTLRRSHQPPITVITAYRVPKSTTPGDYTAYSQQMRQLRMAGYEHPNPREQCITDLQIQIQSLQEQQHAIILLIDANESHSSTSGIGTLLQSTNLVDIISITFPGTPATHKRGSTTIDIIAISPELVPTMQRCGYLPFHESPYAASDHRGGYIDLDMNQVLLGTALQQIHNRPRFLNSKQPKVVERYCIHLGKMCLQHDLLQRRDTINNQTTWTPLEHDELEALDREYTAICIRAEEKSKFPSDAPWHPRLHLAFQLTTYWRVRYSNQRNNTQATKQQGILLAQIAKAQLAVDRISHHTYPPQLLETQGQVRLKLRMAYTFLKLARQEAESERNNYLATEAELAMLQNAHSRGKILKRIQKSEERKKTFQLLKLYIKDNNASTVRELQIPINPLDDPKTTNAWQTVHTQDEVEYNLHQYSKRHFAQADGSPFTRPPLSTLFGYSGLEQGAESILSGNTPDFEMSDTMKLILQSLARKAPTMPFSLPTDEELAKGFEKWPEKTSTSPSGRHLGHYKALLTTPPVHPKHKPLEKLPRSELFHFVADLTRMALQHCHTFGRWEVIWNILLQKTPGDTRIHRHRFLHLKEADDNLITKKYIAKDLMRHAEHHQTIAEEAHGGRKGRQALDVAWMKVLLISQIHHEQKPACIFFNDLTSCYDRITENQSNMSLRAHGCPTELLALHAQNQQRAKYYIVSGHGTSHLYNQHTTTTPFHGSGQGAGDSPARWTLGSTGAIQAYKTLAQPYHFCSPCGHTSPFYLAAFVDDTHNATEMPLHSTIDEMAQIIQRNTSVWEQLMHNISAKLELSKCTCYVYVWDTDSEGDTTPQNAPQIDIRVQESSTQQELIIQTSKLSDPYKLMGVSHTGNQTQQAEVDALLKRSNHYAKQFNLSPIHGAYAELSYNCSYIPSIGYPLAVTYMTESECLNIQKQAINVFLPHMGYNRHFPRALTFLPRHFGGLNITDLYTLQGMRHIFMIIRHLRQNSDIGKKFMITLESYQLRSGLHQPVLTSTLSTSYTTNPWLSSTREFLQHINGQLHIHDVWTPQPLREHDINIMHEALHGKSTPKTLQMLNRCRMYLQVTFLSELSTPTGQYIPGAFCEATSTNPILHQHTTSTFTWPHQPQPGLNSRKQWRQFLNRLKPHLKHLGQWQPSYQTQRKWNAYHNHQTNHIYIQQSARSNTYAIHPITSTMRRKIMYTPSECTTNTLPPLSTPVILQHNSSCHPVPTRQAHKAPPKPQHWRDNLLPWQHQMFQDENTNTIPLQYMPTWPSTQLTLLCASYHQIHGAHHGCIAGEAELHIRYGGISPTSLGHSSTSRATLSSVYAGLLLIKQVWMHHNWSLPSALHIIIQDVSTLSKLQNLLQHKYPPPPLSADYDITTLLMNMFSPSIATTFSVTLLYPQEDPHSTTQADITHQRIMEENVKRARRYHHITTQPTPIPPTHEANKVGLTIAGTTIPNRLEFQIHCASRSPDLAQYLLTKYPDWTHTTLNNIDWHPHGRALYNLSFQHRVTITKFIHGWLPLNHHMHKCDPNIPTTCPACHAHPETRTHFMQCQHKSRHDLRDGFHSEFRQHLTTSKCEPTSQNMLLKGLFTWSHTPPTEPPHNLSPAHQKAFEEQHEIGWDQLWYGRLSNKWAEIHEEYRESPHHPARIDIPTDISPEDLHTTDGRGHQHEIWSQLLIKKIWHFVITTWQLRNEQQHQADEHDPTTTNRLKHQIQTIYQSANQLPIQDKDIVQTHPLDHILQRTRTQQQHWVMINQHFIQTQQKAAHSRTTAHLQDIRQFFTKAPPIKQPPRSQIHPHSPPTSPKVQQHIRRLIQGRITFNNSADPSLFKPP